MPLPRKEDTAAFFLVIEGRVYESTGSQFLEGMFKERKLVAFGKNKSPKTKPVPFLAAV